MTNSFSPQHQASEALQTLPEEFQSLLKHGYHRDDRVGIWIRHETSVAFSYSDGDEVEDRLLSLVRATDDVSSFSVELEGRITDWPSRYHLSRSRANLLRPIQQRLNNTSILEIGCGCGAISRYMGEHAKVVLSLEGSPRRAAIAAERCRDLPNVAVVAEAFDQLPSQLQFDVVTLIGVLEYARIYFPATSGDPIDAMLAKAKSHLKPGGILIVAIENQLGLKYFSGFSEDHVAEAMFGVEDRYGESGVATFGRHELASRIKSVGFDDQEWLFPFPDYKLPTTVFTSAALDLPNCDLSPLLSASVARDHQAPANLGFSLEEAWKPVFRNGMAGHLANSFLVIAKTETPAPCVPVDVLCLHYATNRKPQYAKVTTIQAGTSGIHSTGARLTALPEKVSDSYLQVTTKEPFLTGEQWHQKFLKIVNRPGWSPTDLHPWVRRWIDAVITHSSMRSISPTASLMLEGSMIDAIPCNLIVPRSGPGSFFDLEWRSPEEITLGYLIFRGVLSSCLATHSVAPLAGEQQAPSIIDLVEQAFAAINLPMIEDNLNNWVAQEAQFQAAVTGEPPAWNNLSALRDSRLRIRGSLKKRNASAQSTNSSTSQTSPEVSPPIILNPRLLADTQQYLSAKRLIAEGKFIEGSDTLIALAQTDTSLWEVYCDLGELALQQKDMEGAKQLFNAALSKATKPTRAHIAAAAIASEEGQHEMALEILGPCLHVDSADFEPLDMARKILGKSGELSPIAWARLVANIRRPNYTSHPAQSKDS